MAGRFWLIVAGVVGVTRGVAIADVTPTAVQTGTPRRVIAADDSTRTLAAVGADGAVAVRWEKFRAGVAAKVAQA